HIVVLAATTPPRSLATVLPGCPPPLVAVIDRALAFAKDQRWPAAAPMRDALRDVSLALFGRLPMRETLLPVFGDGAVAMAATRPAEAGVVRPTVGSGLTGPRPAATQEASPMTQPPMTQPMGASPSWAPPMQTK